jgi:hypothetical protein
MIPISLAFAILLPGPAQTAPPELLLGDFDRPQDARLWEPSDKATRTFEPRDPTDLNKACKVVLEGGSYGGIYSYRQPKDWSAYEVLSFVVWSPDRRGLGVRVDDENSRNYSTRYNGEVTIDAGRNLVQIPLRDMAKVIQLAKVKSVGLFVYDPPKGLTLHFDDIRLGPPLTDKVAFIPYEKRLEPVPTIEVESPHFPLARPLAGGPLKVLALYDVEEGRDLAELMQRIDLAVSPVLWSREAGTHKWIGLAYGDRSYDLSRRYLASSAQGPEAFDTLLLPTPTGWGPLGKAATDAILDRVRNRGEGLVLSFPFPGEKHEAPWPDDLKSVSALIDSETDFQRDNGYVRPALGGHIVGKRWRVVKDHPLTRGVPLDALPFEALEVQAYRPAPGAEVLIETENGHPVLAVRQAGKGRVATFAVRSRSLAPWVRDAGARRQWRDYRYWEVFYDLLARAALWTARRDAAPAGDPVPVAAGHADPNLSLKQWRNGKGEVTGWRLDFTAPTRAAIKVSAPELLARDAMLPVAFEPAGPGPHAVRLLDYAGARRRTLLERSVAGKETSLPTRGLPSLALVVEVEAADGSARGETTTYVTPDPAWTDYEVYGWSAGGISYLRDLQLRRLREFGLTTEQVGSPAEARASFRHGFRVHAMISSTGMHAKDFDRVFREYNRSGDPALLVRSPSFADPAFLAEQRARTEAWTRSMLPYAPLTLSLGDETSLTSYVAEFDFDRHPENVKAFVAALQARFGDVAALNAALGDSLASFDGVVPPATADARKSGRFGLWNEWRSHNDDLWTGAFAFYRDTMSRVYPETRLSVSGTQVSHVFNGIDWAKLAPVLGAAADYTGRFQLAQRLSFHPEIRSTPWAGYGREGRGTDHQLWQNLAFDGAGTAFFWYPSLLHPDFSFSRSAADYRRSLASIREGIGLQYRQTRRRFCPVAILWSPRSQRAAWIGGKMDAFVKAEAEVYHGLVEAGYDPFFLSETEAAGAGLEKRGVRVLILPMTLALGRGQGRGSLPLLPTLERFSAAGGRILATHPAAYDEFLKPASAADLATPFPAGPDELQRALEAAGVRPQAEVRDAAGARTPSVTVSCHAFPGLPGAELLTVLRKPVGQKEVLGADGVPRSVPDPSGGPPLLRVRIDVSRLEGRRFFDVRRGRPLSPSGGRLELDLDAGDGRPIASLPYDAPTPALEAAREGDRLKVRVSLGPVKAPHALRLDVGGDPLLSRNLLTDETGKATVEIPLAVEERGLRFDLRATDVMTGVSATLSR